MMANLSGWLESGDIERRAADRKEIARLLAVVDRYLHDADVRSLSADGRFANAYEAGLTLATIVLRASGYRTRTSGGGHHFRTIDLLPTLLGAQERSRAAYLNKCREKRHRVAYQEAGKTSAKEVEELLDEVLHLRNDVIAWLKHTHPDLI